MRPDGTDERILSGSWFQEAPTWAPNGRAIMFYRKTQEGISKLYRIDISGYNEIELNTPLSAADPSWSPHLN